MDDETKLMIEKIENEKQRMHKKIDELLEKESSLENLQLHDSFPGNFEVYEFDISEIEKVLDKEEKRLKSI